MILNSGSFGFRFYIDIGSKLLNILRNIVTYLPQQKPIEFQYKSPQTMAQLYQNYNRFPNP